MMLLPRSLVVVSEDEAVMLALSSKASRRIQVARKTRRWISTVLSARTNLLGSLGSSARVMKTRTPLIPLRRNRTRIGKTADDQLRATEAKVTSFLHEQEQDVVIPLCVVLYR